MAERNPIRVVEITPSYARGFTFQWEVHPAFYAVGPWQFVVEQAETQAGPWEAISPVLVDQYQWSETGPRVVPKDPILYFRICMLAEGQNYWSHVVSPYGDLDRREFLIVRDIIRQELLQQRKLSGVECEVWRKSVCGPKCDECTDFVTGEPEMGDCDTCYGTGFNPGYHGPYPLWVTFSTEKRDKQMQGDQTGVREPYVHSGRVVGTIRLKNDDVIVDSCADRRYFVDVVQNLTEIRRSPVVQQVQLNQVAVTHPVFKLGAT